MSKFNFRKARMAAHACLAIITSGILTSATMDVHAQACDPGLGASIGVTLPGGATVAHIGDTVTVTAVTVFNGPSTCAVTNFTGWLIGPDGSTNLAMQGVILPSGPLVGGQSSFFSCSGGAGGGAAGPSASGNCVAFQTNWVVTYADIARNLTFSTNVGGLFACNFNGIAKNIQFEFAGFGNIPNSSSQARACQNVAVPVIFPCITVTKECDYPEGATCFPYGSPIRFRGQVCNTGDTTLGGITVQDTPGGPTSSNSPITFAATTSSGRAYDGTLTNGECVNYSGFYIPSGSLCGPFTDAIVAFGTDITGLTIASTNACIDPNTGQSSGPRAPATASCNVCTTPAITVTKLCSGTNSIPGGIMGFSGVVSNAGNVPLTNVTVVDDVTLVGGGNLVTNIAFLDIGEAREFSGSVPVPTNVCSITDTLTARGTNICTGLGVVATATTNCPVLTTPAIVLTKSCPVNPPLQGQPLVITATVTNTGNVGLTNIVISNSIAGGAYVALTNFSFANPLQPGDGVSFTFTEPTANVCNVPDTLAGVATDVCGNAASATTNANCEVVCPPDIRVWKQVVCFGPGGQCEPFSDDLATQKSATGISSLNPSNCPAFCYRIIVTNAGQVTLSNLVVIDDSIPDPDLNLAGCNFPSVLPVGGSWTCIVAAVTHCVDTENTVTATAVGQVFTNGTTGTRTVTAADTNSVVIRPISLECNVQILTTNGQAAPAPGDGCLNLGTPYIVRVTVTNTGSYSLQNVTVTSAGTTPLCFISTNIGNLALGESRVVAECRYSCDAAITNNYAVTVNAEASQGTGTNHICDYNAQGEHITVSNTVPCEASVCCSGGVNICVTKEIVCYQPGGCTNDWRDVATGTKRLDDGQCPAFCYRVTVINCSNTALVNITVNDDVLGNLTSCFGFPAELQPGDSRTCIITNITHCEDVTNTVTAIGQSAVSSQTVTNRDTAVALVLDASITCEKIVTSPDDTDQNPSTVTIVMDGLAHLVTNTVVVCNNGEVDLVNVTISDPLLEGRGCVMPAPFSLAAGACITNILCVDAVTLDDAFCSTGMVNQIVVTAQADAGTNNYCVFDSQGTNVTVRTECEALIVCERPGACRTTGGGRQDANQGHVDPRSTDVRYVTHGGQVGAPVGESGFDPDSDCIHGRWTHVRHMKGGLRGNFHARYYDSLMCACLVGDGCTNSVEVTHRLCNEGDRVCGPEPRPAPANKICFSGVGDYTLTNGRRTPRSVLFRVDIEDRSEPGGRHPKGGTPPPDRYRIRIWVLNSSELSQLNNPNNKLCGFRQAISCTDANTPLTDGAIDSNGNAVPLGTQVFGVRVPDIDDGGVLDRGNHQIHPQIKDCDKPRHTCPAQD